MVYGFQLFYRLCGGVFSRQGYYSAICFSLIKTLLNFILLGFSVFFVFHEISSPVLRKGETRVVFPTSRFLNFLFCCFHKVIFKKPAFQSVGLSMLSLAAFHPDFFFLLPYCPILLNWDFFSQWEDLSWKTALAGRLKSLEGSGCFGIITQNRFHTPDLTVTQPARWTSQQAEGTPLLNPQCPVPFPALPSTRLLILQESHSCQWSVLALRGPGLWGSLAWCGCSLKVGVSYASCCLFGEICEQCDCCHHLLGTFSLKFVFFQFKLIIAQGLLKKTMNRGY